MGVREIRGKVKSIYMEKRLLKMDPPKRSNRERLEFMAILKEDIQVMGMIRVIGDSKVGSRLKK